MPSAPVRIVMLRDESGTNPSNLYPPCLAQLRWWGKFSGADLENFGPAYSMATPSPLGKPLLSAKRLRFQGYRLVSERLRPVVATG